MAPKSVLNDLRRQAVQKLLGLTRQSRQHPLARPNALTELREMIARDYPPTSAATAPAALTLLVRTIDQLRSALEWRSANPGKLAMIWCEFEDARRYAEAVSLAHSAAAPIGLATMRIAKPGEDGFLKLIADAGADAILIRNLSSLAYFAQHCPQAHLVGDYSLNVANELAAYVLIERRRFRRPGPRPPRTPHPQL